MFDWVEKYKFGIIAALATYIGIFMYLQMDTYTSYFAIEAFHDGAVVQDDEVDIEKENIEVPLDYQTGEVKNMANDVNDTRDRSYENYSYNNNSKSVEQNVKDLERQFYEEAGGDKERQKLQNQIDQRKNTPTATNNQKNEPASNGGDIAYKGRTMVNYSLKDRQPFQNNRWHIRNPGYTCGYGSGLVHIDIKVNQNGNVTSAEYNPAKSSGASDCMISKGLEYAKKSRFAYSGKAGTSQSGWIQYEFVSQ